MAVLVAGAFAVGIVTAVHLVEERLISAELESDLDLLLKARDPKELHLATRANQFFYFSGGEGRFAIPDDLAELGEGFHEVLREPFFYHVMVKKVGDRRYVLIQDQSDFERREQVMYAIVLIGFLLCVLLATMLGWLLGRKVLEPVARLARQVRHRDQLLALAPPLALDYAPDEVGQLAAAFDETLTQLRQALQREQLFTSDVSHELRTPLMVLASSCELLLVNPILDERARKQVERISRASANMQKLVETFLQLARAESGQTNGVSKVSLQEVADELVLEWRAAIEAKGLCLEYISSDYTSGLYNGSFLRSILGNLLRNALHYCDSGYIRLTLQADGFVVEDSGAGIPQDLHETVFDSFVRGNRERGDGLGLGLSLVRRICLHEGWHIQLTPVVPHGCRFAVDLHGKRAARS
ncbi:sensor histidine kinase [Azomonas macrocytogenes]|nr:HAMP domain-containing sensor histidine kinase [Azomonas macrocytogenes]